MKAEYCDICVTNKNMLVEVVGIWSYPELVSDLCASLAISDLFWTKIVCSIVSVEHVVLAWVNACWCGAY